MRRIALLIVSITVAVAVFTVSAAWRGLERYVAAEEKDAPVKSTAKKIDLNAASARELQQLPGIGPELAERIVRHRPYRKLDELIARKVLGRKEFARIKERIRVNSTLEKKSAQ